MKVAHLNVRSLVGKINELREHILAEDYTLVAVTETWLNSRIPSVNINIPGYHFIRQDRETRGGGVGMYIKQNILFNVLDCDDSLEQLWVKINYKKMSWAVGCLYRAPCSSCNVFIDAFESTLSAVIPITDQIICMGDFNIDLLNMENYNSKHFSELLDSVGLCQIIQEPTRIAQSSSTLIDLIIVSDESLICKCGVRSLYAVSDHELVFCELDNNKPKILTSVVRTFRDYNNLNYNSLTADLHSIPWNNLYDLETIDDKVTFLNENLIILQDKHIPAVTRRFKKQFNPWMTDNIKLLISLRNKALTRFKISKSPHHWNYYKNLRNYTKVAISKEKKAYMEHRLRVGSNIWNDLKQMNIYHKNKQKSIPAHLTDVNAINSHFINSVPTLTVDVNETVNYYESNLDNNVTSILKFSKVDEMIVLTHLTAIKSKATGSDGVQLEFLKLCCPFLLPYLTHLINFCIEHSAFPLDWKHANITPLPKTDLPVNFKDLRPISVLPALSKVLERIISVQLREHLKQNPVIPVTQSGFQPGHSCCSALLNVSDDIIAAADQGMVTLLVLLDYSKAFDTLNHKVLLSVLKYIGLHEDSILFFQNYLSSRTQRTILNNEVSNDLEVKTGVPQGSVLGPLLYIIYSSQLHHHLNYCKSQYYADDSQLYISFYPSKTIENCKKMNEDLNRLHNISQKHSLILNPKKSVVMLFGKKNDRERIKDSINIKVNDTDLELCPLSRNLGVIFDENLRFKKHISNCVQNAYCKLKMLYRARHLLSQKLKVMLCNCLVLSYFNYCDILYGPCLDFSDIRKVQKVQNSCLRFVYGIRRGQRVSHKLKVSNWLNMAARRKLHAACFFHNIIQTKQPLYLHRKIIFRSSVHNINIRAKDTITPPMHKTSFYERSFSYNISAVYNSLPPHFKGLPFSVFKNHCSKHFSA